MCDSNSCESRLLDAKLAEEPAEYQASREIEELVDLVEVIRAIVASRGTAPGKLVALYHRKSEVRGGFKSKLYL